MIDYAYKEKQKFLADCAKRTPIYRENPIAEFIAAVLMFAVFILANFL